MVYPVWRDRTCWTRGFPRALAHRDAGLAGIRRKWQYFPTDVLVTGFDIIFFWVARMMMMQMEVVGKSFHTVYVHGLVRDEKARRCRSRRQRHRPLTLIDDFGADALRFHPDQHGCHGPRPQAGAEACRGEPQFCHQDLERHPLCRNERRAAAGAPAPAACVVNRWIIGEVARIRQATDEALASYRFNDAATGFYAFVWGKVCDWYVELSPLFDGEYRDETPGDDGLGLDQCYILLHPIMPFVTEELWALTGDRAGMLVHGDWPDFGPDLIDADADRQMNWVIR